jgi:hypothetical protein
MKEKKDIHNLDSLEREIYRLKLQAKNMEGKLDKNLDYLQDNYLSMTMNSFFCKDDGKKNGDGSNFKHEGLNATINTIAGNIADKASERLHSWMNSFFGKSKY